MKFLKEKAVLYKKRGETISKGVMLNLKKAIKELNLGTEVLMVASNTIEGNNIIKKKDIPEVPCLVIGKSYYFKDTLLDYEKLKKVLEKWSK